MLKTVEQGSESLTNFLVAGRRQCAQRSTMERHLQHNHLRRLNTLVMPVTPSKFDGCLVGLCAGVTEEHLFHTGQRAQAISNRFLQTDVKKIGGVHEALRLLGHRTRYPRVPMTEVRHSDTR